MKAQDKTKERKGGGRKGGGRGGVRTQGRGGVGIVTQLEWQDVLNPLTPIAFLNEKGVDLIHDASMRIVEEIGIDVMLEEARDVFKKAGCKIEGSMVKMDREMLMELIALAPESFTLNARNPDHSRVIGKNNVSFCMMGSAPNCSDLDEGRRPGNLKDYIKLTKLSQSLNIVHINGGYPVEAIDVSAETRHLECLRQTALHTDKAFTGYSLGPERIQDAMEISRLANGLSHEAFEKQTSLVTIINSNSPLKLDKPMANGIMEMAKRNQAVCLTPFTLAGAMAPVTLAAALSEQNAEGLLGIALAQLIRPHCPVIYGAFTSNVDMRSGAPAFGTPEYTKAALISGQLARRYKLPFRTSNTNASNAADAQATYESMMSIWGALMGGGNFIKHATGWMEGGLVCNFEKVIIDAEMLQTMTEFFKPIALDEDSFGFDAIKEVGPGGHFFGSPHTMARYETAFYSPLLSDWRNFMAWQEAGAVDATQRANQIWKTLLENYEMPPMNEDHKLAVNEFVDRRILEGGAENMY